MKFIFSIPAIVLLVSCAQDDTIDLGSVADGKSDAPAIRDVAVTIPKATGDNPGVRNFSLTSTVDFDVALAYDAGQEARLVVTDVDSGERAEGVRAVQPTVAVTGATGDEHSYKIRIENFGTTTLHAKLSALGRGGVSPELIAAARANLDRVAKEIDFNHLSAYGLSGSLTDQFMVALSGEYERQHPDMYAARVRALASMVFFALPDVAPPADGKLTPFHGLDMDQFDALASIEDQVFEALIGQNNGDTNGVRPFSVCETKFVIETYVRPRVAFPGFEAYRTAYTAFAASCPQKDRDEWYNFRGLGGLRPSWIESNLADRFLRRMAKNCRSPSAAWAGECATWDGDRFGYRQLRNRQLAARTMYYAAADESYLIDSDNSVVLLEDRNGDNVGEWLRPGPITLKTGEHGTLQVNSTGEFTGNLKFVDGNGAVRSITPEKLVAADTVDPRWRGELLAARDMGLMTMFAEPGGCAADAPTPDQCPLLQRFFSMIDRHENFYRTYSALTPDFASISSQPSPLVACSITLAAAHQWDTAGTPSGGTAGFIFLMRIPFKEIVTGNQRSVATIMPGPQTTSLQGLYAGTSQLDMSRAWLDVASLSNNQFESEHEISAFGAVQADEIEGILVIRRPAAVP